MYVYREQLIHIVGRRVCLVDEFFLRWFEEKKGNVGDR